MYAEERQQAIADLISLRGRLSVAELAAQFAVTTETVRRDLSQLERAGVVRRVHGGAVPARALTVLEAKVSERDQEQRRGEGPDRQGGRRPAPPPRRERAARRRHHHRPAGRPDPARRSSSPW